MQHDRFQMIPSTKYFSIAILCFCLQACSGNGLAPVTQRDQANESSTTSKKINKNVKDKSVKRLKKNKSGCHVVVKGDTLYSIAWRYNYDYKKLADWNGIKSPYVIYLGDSICFKQIFKKKKEKLVKKESITKKKEINKSNIKKEGKNKDLSGKDINWFWPTKGKIVKLNSPTSKKGVDISGSPGQVIKAAARGEIVYSGSGLVGYGKLIIIKHSEKFLSAYAYNKTLLVKEGDTIKAGQKISNMGQDPAGRNILHFEIRLNGKPVNPLKYLPNQSN